MIKKLFLGALIACAAAFTWVLLLPDRHATVAQSPTTRVTASQTVPVHNEPKAAPRTVRVVYASAETMDANGKDIDRLSATAPATSGTPVAAGSQIPPQPAIAAGTPAVIQPPAATEPVIEAKTDPDVTVSTVSPDQAININSASIDAMDHLPGAGRIGLAIARNRPYRSVEDLLTKRVLRKSVYEKIRMQLAAE